MRTPTTGRWAVTTEASAYLIDLDEGWIERIPGDDAAQLRLDRARVPLVEVVSLEVGARALLVLRIRDDGVLTVRDTTPVRRIEVAA